jgi:hypothetical protein
MELESAQESALSITSGIRASITSAFEAKPEAPEPEASFATETLNEVRRLAPRSRWMVPASLALVAAIGIAVVVRGMLDRSAARAEIPQVTIAPIAPSRTPAEAPESATATATPVATAVEPAIASPQKAPEVRAPASGGQHVATSGVDPRPAPSSRKHIPNQQARPAGSPAAGASASVGYGYLE